MAANVQGMERWPMESLDTVLRELKQSPPHQIWAIERHRGAPRGLTASGLVATWLHPGRPPRRSWLHRSERPMQLIHLGMLLPLSSSATRPSWSKSKAGVSGLPPHVLRCRTDAGSRPASIGQP
ncbi:hypothetical protein NDU88_003228 [Pleurodeles waltl]|uniref:Uncharacterized protein n=1 Tax=Pleurodeles waltl TaxID=8319 RepID=A0AAV7PCC0_PLEWA|nr:hypothetical protein NDU88_003228 [Pleurodeles waltl]